MAQLKTRAIDRNGKRVVINDTDFNPKTMKAWKDPEEQKAAPEGKAAKEAKG